MPVEPEPSRQADEDWLDGFAAGLSALARFEYGVALIGGDTVRGPLSVSITAIGYLPVRFGPLTTHAARSPATACSSLARWATPGYAWRELADGAVCESTRCQGFDRARLRPQPRVGEDRHCAAWQLRRDRPV